MRCARHDASASFAPLQFLLTSRKFSVVQRYFNGSVGGLFLRYAHKNIILIALPLYVEMLVRSVRTPP